MSSSIIDMITSTMIFGVLALTVARVQANINISMYENQYNVVTQTNAVELARQIEWDFTKAGYQVTGDKILIADSTRIEFKADLDSKQFVNTLIYTVGDTSQCSMTMNKNDFPMFRTQDGRSVKQNWGLTYFRLTYYDEMNKKIPTPITNTTDLKKIHAIRVSFRLESPEPVVSLQDTVWSAVSWEKTIVPRNLIDLTY
jgi:hypothetical protein